jgi:hypothetical protein
VISEEQLRDAPLRDDHGRAGRRSAGPRLAGRGSVVPEKGVEPSRACAQRILSPPRLPFRHSGACVQSSGLTGLPQDDRLEPCVAPPHPMFSAETPRDAVEAAAAWALVVSRAKLQTATVERIELRIRILRPSSAGCSRTAHTALKSSVVGNRQKPFLLAPLSA